MLGLIEPYAAPNAESRALALQLDVEPAEHGAEFKVYQLHLGAERFCILADSGNRPVGLVANRLSLKLAQMIGKMDFCSAVAECREFERSLGAGYVLLTLRAAEVLRDCPLVVGRLVGVLAENLREGAAV